MSLSRYRNTSRLNFNSKIGTSRAMVALRAAVTQGVIPIDDVVTLTGNQRLDHLAAIYYKDARLWWILAAASDIGWGLQVPPGTVISIPDLSAVNELLK